LIGGDAIQHINPMTYYLFYVLLWSPLAFCEVGVWICLTSCIVTGSCVLPSPGALGMRINIQYVLKWLNVLCIIISDVICMHTSTWCKYDFVLVFWFWVVVLSQTVNSESEDQKSLAEPHPSHSNAMAQFFTGRPPKWVSLAACNFPVYFSSSILTTPYRQWNWCNESLVISPKGHM